LPRWFFDIALDREFDYLVPPELADRVHAGSRVTAGLGRASKTGSSSGARRIRRSKT
jgi:primosomal protein N'